MKKTKIIVALFSVGLLMASCDSKGHDEHSEQDDHTEMESHEGHDHDEASKELGLNDGQKWKINPEMMVHLDDMKSQVSTFDAASKKDYAALGESLSANINLLTSSCTMTGESHDELHKWLHPYIELVGELSEAKDDASAKVVFGKIQKSIATFNQFFE